MLNMFRAAHRGFLNAQHVSSGTPLIIRSSKLYLGTAHSTGHCPLNLGNGQSPHGHINQRLQIQFIAPDDERCAARNMLSI